jgi:hypothetical protein
LVFGIRSLVCQPAAICWSRGAFVAGAFVAN